MLFQLHGIYHSFAKKRHRGVDFKILFKFSLKKPSFSAFKAPLRETFYVIIIRL